MNAAQVADAVRDAVPGCAARAAPTVGVVVIDRSDTVLRTTPDDLRADAVFEIGSLTKPVTATLLTRAVADGLLDLDDPIGRWLPAGSNGDITARQLATHTSGLPKVSGADAVTHADDPYRVLDTTAILDRLRRIERAGIGQYAYSNLGYQLLGVLLERVTDRPYAQLVGEWPGSSGFGADVPGIALPGHAGQDAVARWRQPLPGAGGLNATVSGLADWLRAVLASMESGGAEPHDVALGWQLDGAGAAWHTGQTAGFSAVAIVDAAAAQALAAVVDETFLGRALLDRARAALTGSPAPVSDQTSIGPEWETRARDVTNALIGERPAAVHEMMTPQLRARITSSSLSATWLMQSVAVGAVRDLEVSCHRRGRYVAADVTIVGEHRPGRLALVFTPDQAIARIAFLRPDQPAPW